MRSSLLCISIRSSVRKRRSEVVEASPAVVGQFALDESDHASGPSFNAGGNLNPSWDGSCRSRDTCRNRRGDWRRPTQSRVTTPLASKTAGKGAAIPAVASHTAAMTLEVIPASYVGCFVGSDFHIPNIAYVVQNRQIRETKKEMEKLRQRAWMTEEASGGKNFKPIYRRSRRLGEIGLAGRVQHKVPIYFFSGKVSPNFDPKNMMSTYTKGVFNGKNDRN